MLSLNKNSTKPMTVGINSSKTDIKKVFFSHDGDKLVSIDNVLSALIWDQSEENLLKQLKGIRAQYASFTPDDSKLIILYRASIYVINMTDFSQIRVIDNGINIYGGDCSPDNLYFAHSNNSNIYIRNVQNMDLINMTEKGQCNPYFVQFGQDNFLYTSSLDNGTLCKWNATNLQILGKVELNSKVHDIGTSPNYLVISSENNFRNIYFISLPEFTLSAKYSVPASRRIQDYDNNKEIHCAYNTASNVFMCVSKGGRYLFLYNGTTTQYIGNKTLSGFTGYTVDYNDITDVLVFGGQFVNSNTQSYDDQIGFYSLQYQCSELPHTVAQSLTQQQRLKSSSWILRNSQCPCVRDYIWNSKIGQCERLVCKNNNIMYNQQTMQSQCVCPKQYWWDYQVLKCQINCLKKENTLHESKYPYFLYKNSIQACPCKQNYRWNINEEQCVKFQCKSQGTTGNYSANNLNQCQCIPKFYSHSKSCILNCSDIRNTQNSNSYLDSKLGQQKCQCKDGFQWISKSYQCRNLLTNAGLQNQKPQASSFPVIYIIIPIIAFIVLLAVCLLVCIIRKKCKKSGESYDKDVVASTQTATEPQNQNNEPKLKKSKRSFHQQILKKISNNFIGEKNNGIIYQEDSEKRSQSMGTDHERSQANNQNCVVCQGAFPDFISDCEHRFHSICLKNENKNKSQVTCPICRLKIKLSTSPRQNHQNIQHYVIDEGQKQQNIERQKKEKRTPRRRRN